jgi:hypothetical protein
MSYSIRKSLPPRMRRNRLLIIFLEHLDSIANPYLEMDMMMLTAFRCVKI